MAIQLSDRDTMIFKFIEEHQVLLEKHIAWFISLDDKPVLIRDRLRKLFYLDYLLCERHGGKLPWWTTPTKPLVYMLSPMTRQIVSAVENDVDLNNCEIQRHLLEIANLRMLFLMDQKEAMIKDCQWTTIQKETVAEHGVDAVVTFKRNDVKQTIALLNQPTLCKETIIESVEKALVTKKVDTVWIISRDEAHQQAVQKLLAGTSVAQKVAFATHQELYKYGIVKAKWQGAEEHFTSVITESVAAAAVNWGNLTAAQAFS